MARVGNAFLIFVCVAQLTLASPSFGGGGRVQAASPEVSLLYFTAQWCKPCGQMKPTLDQLASEGWQLEWIDVNARPDLVSRLTVRNLPTLIIMGPQGEIDRIVGVTEYETVDKRIQRAAARFGGGNSRTAPAHRSNPAHQSNSAHRSNPAHQSNPAQQIAQQQRSGPSHSFSGDAQPAAVGQDSLIVRGQSPSLMATNPMLTSGMLAAGSAGTTRKTGGTSSSLVSHASASSAAASHVRLTPQQAVARAAAATVRIRVDEGNTTAHGTGTIVDVHGEEALVLTCGHLFRDMQPGSVISVDLFAGTPNEINLPSQLIDFKAEEEDIGLITFRLPVPVEPVDLLPRGTPLQIGQQVFSFGCDHGSNPSRHDTRITNINRYIGPENIEISGAPAVGRSGGGLFDLQGNLIGVCNAADANDDEGIYASADVIYDQINRLGLSHLFLHSASGASAVATQASAPAPQMQSSPGTLSASTGPQELICIVKGEDGSERVITVHQPSGQLLQQLQAASAAN